MPGPPRHHQSEYPPTVHRPTAQPHHPYPLQPGRILDQRTLPAAPRSLNTRRSRIVHRPCPRPCTPAPRPPPLPTPPLPAPDDAPVTPIATTTRPAPQSPSPPPPLPRTSPTSLSPALDAPTKLPHNGASNLLNYQRKPRVLRWKRGGGKKKKVTGENNEMKKTKEK